MWNKPFKKWKISIFNHLFFFILEMFIICTTVLHHEQQREYDYDPKTERLHQWNNVLQSIKVEKVRLIFSSDCTGNQESTLQTGLKERHWKRYSDSKTVVLNLLAQSPKKKSKCTSKRSKKYKHFTPRLKDRHASTGKSADFFWRLLD